MVRTIRRNPAWPVYVLFLGLPLWWVLGISHFMWPVVAIFMLISLLIRREVRIPGNVGIWTLFLGWMLVSAVALDSSSRFLGFGLRFAFYASAGIFLLYLYNSRQISSRAILLSLAGYWVLVVFGGYLGIFFPKVAFRTPIEHFLPGSLRANQYVHDMTYARFAEIQGFLGHPVNRPATFFTYTNGWGSSFALLTPFAVAALYEIRSRRWRWILAVTLALSIWPVVVSLNRGLWLSLGIAALYIIVRYMGSGNGRGAIRLAALVGAVALIIAVTPLSGLIEQRFDSGGGASNAARRSLYDETFARVKESPWIGFGAPRPAQTSGYLDSVGTQGQVLYLVFSHGYPGLILFFAWLGHAFLRSARPPTPAAFAGHVSLLVAAVQAPFYGLLTQMLVVAAAAALALREEAPARPWIARARTGPSFGLRGPIARAVTR